jgi:hypothetical protein
MTQTSKTRIAAHDVSHPGSASICDDLLRALGQRIPGLKRRKVQKWCCFYQPERKRCAYLSCRSSILQLRDFFKCTVTGLALESDEGSARMRAVSTGCSDQ